MLLGQMANSTPNRFSSFTRPQEAQYYTPRLAPTAFYSHINPFMHTMLPIAAYRPRLPDLPQAIQPGVLHPSMRAPFPTGPAPAVPMAPEQLRGGFGFFGLGASASASSPLDFIETDPSRTARTGTWLNVPSTSRGLRAGVTQAGPFLQRLHPAAYPYAALPAGTY